MSRNGHATIDTNREVLERRGRPGLPENVASKAAKVHAALDRPQTFGALLGWFRREWQEEFPRRLHERGIEPDSQLGAPRLAGGMRTRLAAAVDREARTKTDYNAGHDTYSSGAAPLYPVLDALERYARKAPLLSRYLEAIAYRGFDWRTVANERLRIWDGTAFVPDDEHHFQTTRGALDALWTVWSRGQAEAAREVE